jgi:signal transduction histidine kinase/ActR/RegA family two-component response regulator
VVLAAGTLALHQQLGLSRLSQRAILRDAGNSAWASRAAVSALECRRYEKDLFLSLRDPVARRDYLQRWNEAWDCLHSQLEQMRRLDLPDRHMQVDQCLAAATNYRRHMRDIVAQIERGAIRRPEDANLAIAPHKDDFRRIARDTAVIAEECLAEAGQSGMLLGRFVLLNLTSTCLLIVVPSGLIVAWTIWLTRAIVARNVELVQARLDADAANRAKSGFLANMSHELRTPMTAILGYADVLMAEVDGPEAREAAVTIRRNGDNLLCLINDILDLSKIESGRLAVRFDRCSPMATVADVLSLMRVRADAKNLALKAEYRSPIPETISTDAARLRQILINLVGNAIKFTEQGSVRLAVQLVSTDDGPHIEFRVIDTGIGMTEEQQSHLFQRFGQVHGQLNEVYGGTGLGLAISRRLADMLHGAIRVESVPGRGSTFTLSIATGPLDGVAMLENPSEALGPRPTQPQQPPIRLACRVLLAEDGPDNRRLISLLLHKAGAEVTTAENGQVAIDRATTAQRAATPFDVVLMDMQMPVVDGYEATRRLRALGYSGTIVALTAHAMFDDRQKCLDAGCDDYLTKPVDRHSLLATVEKQLVAGRG